MNPKSYAQLLYEVLENKSAPEQDKILANFKNVLIKNRHAYFAPAIEKEFIKIQKEKQQEKITYISSASELNAKQKKEVENISSEPREFSVNPELLGGVTVRSKDIVYNATLRKKLESMKSYL